LVAAMTGKRLGDDFAFADVIRISTLFKYTGVVKSRQNPLFISRFRRSAKWGFWPFGIDAAPL
jgi:hypothetical protein